MERAFIDSPLGAALILQTIPSHLCYVQVLNMGQRFIFLGWAGLKVGGYYPRLFYSACASSHFWAS
jgi:hypothetical protein